ncbi:MAG: HAMP domain-containing protein [Nitrospinae bacterium]|nr:HAMP domain-containing protein [Nitrospinota bacterium]
MSEKNDSTLRTLLNMGHNLTAEARATGLRRLRIAVLALLSVMLLFTMYKLVYDGPRIGGINNLNLFFLLNLNILLLLVMALLVGRNMVKLFMERQEKALKAAFRTKLILAFLGLTLIPTVLLFVVASGLITNSIDNWSNITVERSLRDSLDVAHDYYSQHEKRAEAGARDLAGMVQKQQMLLNANRVYLSNMLPKKIGELNAAGGAVYGGNFTLRAKYAANGDDEYVPPALTGFHAEKMAKGETFAEKHRTSRGAYVVAFAPVLAADGAVEGAVLLTEPIDPWLLDKIETITRTTEEYRQIQSQKLPIKMMYEVTLGVVTLVVIFGAIWFGYYLARDITTPIQKLVDATRKVAEGDLSVRVEEKSRDEIGFLVRSFNRMTEDLDTSRQKLDANHRELVDVNQELDRRRRHIETILSTIAAGVISIDHRGHVTTCNPSATAILHLDAGDPRGKYYEEIFSHTQLDPVRSIVREMGKSRKESIKQETQINVDGVIRTLLVHISTLKDQYDTFMGMVVVFEDLTAIINAEKTAAWRDIAQHLAHEIKNPLTPIKLNTERLRRNYETDRAAFDRNFDAATRVIIHEVDVLVGLVDSFSRFGQLPVAKPEMHPLHRLIEEVVQMFHGMKQDVALRADFDPSIHDVRLDREQMHRVFRNLVENAVNAVEPGGGIEIKTRRVNGGNRILIEVRDDGPGVDPANLDKIFLPYFSTKKKGTGLGLAIVNRIIADHQGTITAKNVRPHGLLVSIEIPAA